MKKIMDKYRELSIPLKASFWFVICSLLQKGIAFIVTPVYTRMLTKEQYGVYSVYQSWMSIISIFATLNLSGGVLNNSLNKCKSDEEKSRVLSNFQFLEIVTIIISCIIVVIINYFAPDLFAFSSEILILLFIHILMNSAVSLWSTKSKFDYNYKQVVFVSLISSILTALFSILFIMYGNNKNASLIIGGVLAALLCYVGVFFFNLFKGKSFFDFSLWKYAVKFNLPLLPHYLSLAILASSDRIMIEKMTSISDAALYSIAYNIAIVINIFSTAINASLIPWTYKNLKEKKYDNISGRINYILIFLSVICLIFMLFGPEAIYIMGGEEYMMAKWVIPPIASSVFFLFLYPLFGNVEFYYEKRIFTMVASICAAITNIILNFIFIPIFGYVAAAFTTLICYALLSIFHYFAYNKIRKKESLPKIYDSKKLIILTVINFAFIAISYLLYFNCYIRYIFILLLIIVLAINYKKIFKILGGIK